MKTKTSKSKPTKTSKRSAAADERATRTLMAESSKQRRAARAVQAQANTVAEVRGLRTILPALQREYGSDGSVPEGQAARYQAHSYAEADYIAWKTSQVSEAMVAAGLSAESCLLVVSLSKKEIDAMPKEVKTEVVKAEARAAEVKAAKRSTEDVETEHGTFRKGSVLYGIYRSWCLKEGSTHTETLDRLCKEFPDRPREHMKVTIAVQTNRMPGVRNFTLGRSDEGRYGIHIEGRSTKKILTPEVAAARALKAEALTKAKAEKAKAAAEKAKVAAAAEAAKVSAAAKAAAPKGPQVVGKLGKVMTSKKK